MPIVFDFSGNTPNDRAWVRSIFESSHADHVLHYIVGSDESCKARLRLRNETKREGPYFGFVPAKSLLCPMCLTWRTRLRFSRPVAVEIQEHTRILLLVLPIKPTFFSALSRDHAESSGAAECFGKLLAISRHLC